MFPPVLIRWFARHWKPKRGRRPLTTRSFAAYAEASIIGIVAALSAVFLKYGSGWLGTLRVQTASELPPWLVLPVFGVCLGYLAGWMVETFAPEAAGGGVPRVKASLASMKTRLSWRAAFVKLFASIITIGSGITMGRQAPTVHVGASLAGGLSRWVPTSPVHRRQIIAAGAAAGLAAAFNAPISGVLFVIEELLHDLSGLTLGTAIMASFIGGVVSRLLGGHNLELTIELTKYESSFFLPEIPFYLILGILAGVFAALFHKCLLVSIKIYHKLGLSLPLRVALAGLITGIVVAFLPEGFRNNTGLREFIVTGESSILKAVVVFLVHFCLTSIAFGSGAPAGLFGPSLILGSSLGYGIGRIAELIMPGISPETYALAGMGAFFSGFSKVPITAIVIIFEITADFDLVLPLMIGSVISYIIANKIAPGSLNDKLLELKGIKLQKQNPADNILSELTVQDVMHRRVKTLSSQMTVDEALQSFSHSQYRGFPVVESDRVVGIVTQTDLQKIGDRDGVNSLTEIMTPEPITVTPIQSLRDILCILDHHEISRLPVVDRKRLVGIITRTDIIRATAHYFNGETTPIFTKKEPSYLVYQTQSPSIGKGRLLVPVANPETATILMKMAIAIARDRDYEIECLQLILVPERTPPAETKVDTTKSHKLLDLAQALTQQYKIPVHTQIRVTHDISQAILETINQRHIDLILMGWKGKTFTPDRIFGGIVDTIIRQATCEVIIVRPGKTNTKSLPSADSYSSVRLLPPTASSHRLLPPAKSYRSVANITFNSWLIPMAGGLNAKAGIKLLPALVTLADRQPKIRLTRIFKSSESKPDMKALREEVCQSIRDRGLSSKIQAAPVEAKSVPAGVIHLVKQENYDVVIVGASREGMLQKAIKQNIPDAIAVGVDSTVILVREAMN